jgi:hypothetical protein
MVDSVLEFDKELLAKSGMQLLPASFQPDLVSETCQRAAPGGTLQPSDPALPACRVSSEFYLTKVRPKQGYVDANIRPELQPFLRLGRPDLDQQFEQMKAEAQALGEQRVAVAVCGPPSMVDAVRRCCSRNSGGGVVFDLHAEVFEF